MRILIWHGYLLGGTGSNVYTRALASEWSRAGHEVVVVCQDRHAERYDLGGARVVVPELPDGLLPVFVLDEYEGLDARLLPDFTAEQRDAYVDANAAALRALLPADVLFANHVLMGAPVARASGARYAVKAHGSELEYSMRGNAELARLGAEALAGLIDESGRDPKGAGERHPDAGNAERFASFFAEQQPTIIYFGKLIENKGVQVLL